MLIIPSASFFIAKKGVRTIEKLNKLLVSVKSKDAKSKDKKEELKKLIALDTTLKKIVFHSAVSFVILKILTFLGYFLSDLGKKYIILKPKGLLLQNLKILRDAPIISIIMVLFLIYVNVKIYFWYLERTSNADDRNLPVEKNRSEDGSTWWMDRKKQKEVFNLVKKSKLTKDDGLVLAENKNGEYLCLDWDNTNTSASNRNLVIYGSPGTRKTSSIILNSIYCCMRKGINVILTDPKGELYKETVAAALKYGYKVKVFNVRGNEFDNSCGWDCFRFIKESKTPVEDAATFASIIMNNTDNGSSTPFWFKSEYNLCAFLILFVAVSPKFRPAKSFNKSDDDLKGSFSNNAFDKYRTIGEFYKILSTVSADDLATCISKLDDDDPCKAPGSIWADNKEKAQIKSSLAIRLNILQSKKVQRVLSEDEIRFEEMAKEKTICYVINSDQNTTFTLMTALFIGFAFINLARYADSLPSQKLPNPCYFIFEELYSVGRIPAFATKLSTLRSRSINVMLCLQSLGQLKDTYSKSMEEGEYAWEIIQNACGTEICLGAGDKTTQDYFKNVIGDCTLKVTNKRHRENIFNIFHVAMNRDISNSTKKRSIMTNSELFGMAKNKIIISIKSAGSSVYLYKAYYKDFKESGYKVYSKESKNPIEIKANTFYPVWRQLDDFKKYKNSNGDLEIPNKERMTPKLRKVDVIEENIKLIRGSESYEIKESKKFSFMDNLKSIINDEKTKEDIKMGDHDVYYREPSLESKNIKISEEDREKANEQLQNLVFTDSEKEKIEEDFASIYGTKLENLNEKEEIEDVVTKLV